jgi:hypothetical protein
MQRPMKEGINKMINLYRILQFYICTAMILCGAKTQKRRIMFENENCPKNIRKKKKRI